MKNLLITESDFIAKANEIAEANKTNIYNRLLVNAAFSLKAWREQGVWINSCYQSTINDEELNACEPWTISGLEFFTYDNLDAVCPDDGYYLYDRTEVGRMCADALSAILAPIYEAEEYALAIANEAFRGSMSKEELIECFC